MVRSGMSGHSVGGATEGGVETFGRACGGVMRPAPNTEGERGDLRSGVPAGS